jgi:hypothetical protein
MNQRNGKALLERIARASDKMKARFGRLANGSA